MNRLIKLVHKVASLTRPDKAKQGKSCVCLYISEKICAKLYRDAKTAGDCHNSQFFLALCQLAPKPLCSPRRIELDNHLTGGLCGIYWFYLSERAYPVIGRDKKTALRLLENKLLKIEDRDYDLYTSDNMGICKGKLVLLDTEPCEQ